MALLDGFNEALCCRKKLANKFSEIIDSCWYDKSWERKKAQNWLLNIAIKVPIYLEDLYCKSISRLLIEIWSQASQSVSEWSINTKPQDGFAVWIIFLLENARIFCVVKTNANVSQNLVKRSWFMFRENIRNHLDLVET